MPLEQADPELYGIIKDEKHRQRYVEDGMARTGGRADGRAWPVDPGQRSWRPRCALTRACATGVRVPTSRPEPSLQSVS